MGIDQRSFEGRGVALGALAWVLAGESARDEKRPIAGLQRQQLPERALARIVERERAALGRAGEPGQIRHRGSAPGPQVPSGSPRAHAEGSRRRGRVMALEPVVERSQVQALARCFVEHRVQPLDPFVPPVPEQLGVERAHTYAATPDPGPGAGDEVPRVL